MNSREKPERKKGDAKETHSTEHVNEPFKGVEM
jgi:hypothetical protein